MELFIFWPYSPGGSGIERESERERESEKKKERERERQPRFFGGKNFFEKTSKLSFKEERLVWLIFYLASKVWSESSTFLIPAPINKAEAKNRMDVAGKWLQRSLGYIESRNEWRITIWGDTKIKLISIALKIKYSTYKHEFPYLTTFYLKLLSLNLHWHGVVKW